MPARNLALSFRVAVVSLIISANAFAQKDLKSQIVGAYSLAAIYDQLADGKKNDTWGEGVEGSAIFTSSGILVCRSLRPTGTIVLRKDRVIRLVRS